jgi:hypothetical protein
MIKAQAKDQEKCCYLHGTDGTHRNMFSLADLLLFDFYVASLRNRFIFNLMLFLPVYPDQRMRLGSVRIVFLCF